MAGFIKWTESLSVRSEKIDEQHKKLIEILNKLYEAFMNKTHVETVGEIVKELGDYTHYHFRTEEAMLQQYNYPDIEVHKHEHTEFLRKIKDYQEELSKNPSGLTYKIMAFLREWICNHIMASDQKYVSLYTK